MTRRASSWATAPDAPRGPWVPPASDEVEALLHEEGSVVSLVVQLIERRGDEVFVHPLMERTGRWVPWRCLESRKHRRKVDEKAAQAARKSTGRSLSAAARHVRPWRESMTERLALAERELLGLARRVDTLEAR